MLRGVMAGHPLAGRELEGAALVAIDGQPAWWVLDREKRRITEFLGSSSDHSLFSSMGNRFLPFGESREIELTLLNTEGEATPVTVGRWGPGGKAFSPTGVQMPDGAGYEPGASAVMLATDWCERVGYIWITGGMSDETVRVFHAKFDALHDAEAILLDCRGMGGGSDSAAWEMAGRFFEGAVANGRSRKIEPSGSWQFSGAVVMLQDELEVSAAETFTWALSETERVLSVGRRTGGWSIIPKRYDCPSGIVSIRLGVVDRPTPITAALTEGTGWVPDVVVPYGPRFTAARDPERERGLEILRLGHAGAGREVVKGCFAALTRGEVTAYLNQGRAIAAEVPG